MDEKELEFFDSVSSRMPDDVAVLALKYLSDYLNTYYGKKGIIHIPLTAKGKAIVPLLHIPLALPHPHLIRGFDEGRHPGDGD